MRRVLDIQDLVELGVGGAIEIDESRSGSYTTTLAAADYELLPRNAAVGPEPAPYKQIALTSWGSQFAWPVGANVRVTGIHGWPAVPHAIWLATIEVTAILAGVSIFTTDRISESIDAAVGASPQARAMLQGLMSNYSAGVYF